MAQACGRCAFFFARRSKVAALSSSAAVRLWRRPSSNLSVLQAVHTPLTPPGARFESTTPTSEVATIHEQRVREFHMYADETLETLSEVFENLPEEPGVNVPDGYDVQCGGGVLTIELDSANTYVLNKQAPNQQIWISSPFTGPKRFNLFRNNRWLTDKQESLFDLLSAEMSTYFKAEINVKTRVNETNRTKWK
ncbi:uncharacterized protein LOC135830969 [Sycon ciliatum]|uniref:uncharacterized protein LOC135830969 n=1 Tax=Sycon ciliatum TaxID=27933 RepID=UPI0031F690A6